MYICIYPCVSQLSAVTEGADGRTSLYSSRDGSTPLAATGSLSPFSLPSQRLSLYTLSLSLGRGGGVRSLTLPPTQCARARTHIHTLTHTGRTAYAGTGDARSLYGSRDSAASTGVCGCGCGCVRAAVRVHVRVGLCLSVCVERERGACFGCARLNSREG